MGKVPETGGIICISVWRSGVLFAYVRIHLELDSA